MSVSVIEQGHIVSGVELASSLVGTSEALEKCVRAHDELELGGADCITDVEHALFEFNLGDAPDVEHTFEVLAGGHSLPPILRATEPAHVPAAILNELLLP